MDAELNKAFTKAIEKYFADDKFSKSKSLEKSKYNKKYFDDAESKFFPKEEVTKEKVKKEVKDGL